MSPENAGPSTPLRFAQDDIQRETRKTQILRVAQDDGVCFWLDVPGS